MRRFFLIILSFVSLTAAAQMTDQQIVEQAQRMQAQGMDAGQIGVALMQSGATQQQLQRLQGQAADTSGAQTQTQSVDPTMLSEPPRVRESDTTVVRDIEKVPLKKSDIFGHDLFNNDKLTFEPQLNIATPENYVLGPGDEVIIDIWGNSQQTIHQTVSPDGVIVAPPVGLIRLSGLSVGAARERVRQAFSKVYDLGSGTQINLSLGEIRSIQVHVMGEVTAPGTYTVSSLATLFHVLYAAGGVSDIGSLRDIRVSRGGREIAAVDVYAYLLQGRSDMDISLRDGDVVIVKPYANLVEVAGKVKRPMRYETRQGETLKTLLDYAGGLTGDAYAAAVRVVRKSGREWSVFNVRNSELDGFAMMDQDSVSVDAVLDRFENRIEVRGAVFRPGIYALSNEVNTVRALVERAEGLRGDVFAGRAVLYRKKENYTDEALAVDIVKIMAGEAADIELRKDDVLEIPSIFDITEGQTVEVSGAVSVPGTYAWAEGMSIEDLVLRAGGLLESASTVRVDVVQRIKDPASTEPTSMRAVHLSFALKDGLTTQGDPDYTLHPFDAVYIRQSPGYHAQQNVTIGGQVLFGGEYALTESGERLSSLVARAGGLTPEAYIQGARLLRRKTEQERARDSLSAGGIVLTEDYPVAIELEKALAKPGSNGDIVLREGDRVFVPDYLGTVTVSGAVTYPNTVAFNGSKSIYPYINQAGGFAPRSRKRHTYIVHMNGMVEAENPRVTPGSVIVVPSKGPRTPMRAGEIVGLGTGVASLAVIVVSLLR